MRANAGLLGTRHLGVPAMFEALDAMDCRGYVCVKSYRHDWSTGAQAAMHHLKSLGLV